MSNKLFGDMTPQEINLLARNLKREGEFDEIRMLAEENRIEENKVVDFIKGNTIFLVNPSLVNETQKPVQQEKIVQKAKESRSTADVKEDVAGSETEAAPAEQPVIDPEVLLPDKTYATAEEKMLDECEQMCKDITDETQKAIIQAQMKPVIDFINSSGEELKSMVLLNHKSWKRCFDYMSDKAKEMRVNNASCVCVADATVFGWIKEYFELDDRAAILEELRKKEEERLKREEEKKKASEKKKKTGSRKKTKKASDEEAKAASNTVSDKTEKPANEESKTAKEAVTAPQDNTQMSMFDTMG